MLVHLLIFFNLLLAFVAFMKDMVFASYFGTSGLADSINLAFFLPDTLGNNLIGAAIAVSSIPILTKLALKQDPLLYQTTVKKLVIYLLSGTLILLLSLLISFQSLFQLFISELGEPANVVYRYFLIMSPIICIAPLWLLGSSVLQSNHKFIIPAIAPILYNFFLLIALLWCQWQGISQTDGGVLFSFANTFGIMICALLAWCFILRLQKWNWNWPELHWKGDREIKQVLQTFAAYAVLLFFSQLGLFAERIFASTLQTGTIAALSYAYRLSQFPLWVFIAAINTFILPTISLHIEKNDMSSLKRDLVRSLVLVIVSSGSAALLFVFFSEPILTMLFLRGSFNAESVSITNNILKGYGLSIIGQSLFIFCTRYYVAQNAMKMPLIIGLLAGLLNIALLFFLVPWLGAKGIGYSAAISSSISGGLLAIHFHRHLIKYRKGGTSGD